MIARDLQQSLRIVQAQCDDHGAAVRTLVGEVDAMLGEVQALRAERTEARIERDVIKMTLATFYSAPLSMSSVQPILDLAVKLNPSLDLQWTGQQRAERLSVRVPDDYIPTRSSALVCGCDAGANHFCEAHRRTP